MMVIMMDNDDDDDDDDKNILQRAFPLANYNAQCNGSIRALIAVPGWSYM